MITRRKILQVLSSIPLFGITKLVKGNILDKGSVGTISEPIIFDKALSTSEVQTLYNINLIKLDNMPEEYYSLDKNGNITTMYSASIELCGHTFTVGMYKSTLLQMLKDLQGKQGNLYYYALGTENLYGFIRSCYV